MYKIILRKIKKHVLALFIFILIINAVIKVITFAYDENQPQNKPPKSSENITLKFKNGEEEVEKEVERDYDIFKMINEVSEILSSRLDDIESGIESKKCNLKEGDYANFTGALNVKINTLSIKISDQTFKTSCHRVDYYGALEKIEKLELKIKEVYEKNICSPENPDYYPNKEKIKEVCGYVLEDLFLLLNMILENQTLPYYLEYAEFSKEQNSNKKEAIFKQNGVSPPPSDRDVQNFCPEVETNAKETYEEFNSLKEEISKVGKAQERLGNYSFTNKAPVSPVDFSSVQINYSKILRTKLTDQYLENEKLKKKDARELDFESVAEEVRSDSKTSSSAFDKRSKGLQKEENDLYILRLRDFYANLYADQSAKYEYNVYKSMEIRNVIWEDAVSNLGEFNESFSKLLGKQCGG